ncbi:hypothetical protein HOC80_03040 [archaeon]|jgi:hypothetical protein|nr:hypothetical protein [archaeon]MBT4417055.1 hypothetical protein [archaeon]
MEILYDCKELEGRALHTWASQIRGIAKVLNPTEGPSSRAVYRLCDASICVLSDPGQVWVRIEGDDSDLVEKICTSLNHNYGDQLEELHRSS